MSVTLTARSHGVLRYSAWDALLILLSLVYAALLLSVPSIPLIAIGLWWTANTVAHNFIHTPFFRARSVNRLYSTYLSALMGSPRGSGAIATFGITAGTSVLPAGRGM